MARLKSFADRLANLASKHIKGTPQVRPPAGLDIEIHGTLELGKVPAAAVKNLALTCRRQNKRCIRSACQTCRAGHRVEGIIRIYLAHMVHDENANARLVGETV